jgi:site-specific DNA recombinase
MQAAIYARRSTEQKVAEEFKSVTRQTDNARAYAASQGWTVADEHVYVDDGVSGTEFAKRPGLQRMLSALKSGAPFRWLIVSEQKSLGRQMLGTANLIVELRKAGVEVVEYVHGQSLTPKNTMDTFVSIAHSLGDESHAVKTSERMHEAHTRLAVLGHVVGGRIFGYRNKHVYSGKDEYGNPLRSHVERVVEPAEAKVVLRIFKLYAEGFGLKRIVKQLAGEKAASPRPFHRKDGTLPAPAWATSTVRAVLRRDIYRGVVVWNRMKKRNADLQVAPSRRPEGDRITATVEHLRIVPADLWSRVQSRFKEVDGRAVRFESGRLSGRPPKHATPNLLAGIATCGLCGAGLIVEKGGGQARYHCYTRRHKGGTCENDLRVPVSEMNEAVLVAIEEHALTPEAVEHVIQLTEGDERRDQRTALERELKDIAKRIERLLDAIETGRDGGGDTGSVLTRIRDLKMRSTAIKAELKQLQPLPRLAPKVVNDRLGEWRRLLRQSTTQARAVLQRVVAGRITFTPKEGVYEFNASTRFDRLFTGLVVNYGPGRPGWIAEGDVTGTEGIGPEDTFEGDYGRVLERALAGKGGRPWWDSNPRSSP